jgi:FkbM family methyltransferase
MSANLTNDATPYGRHSPLGVNGAIIRLTRRCAADWASQRVAFFLRSMAIRRLGGQPVDIEAVGAKMRLYPRNNVAEKRLLFTPQYFDARERALLAERLSDNCVFIDVGASVGGYALFVAAQVGRRARILAIEPSPEIFERLAYNIRQNDFANVKAISCALADYDGEITLFVHEDNSGESSVRVVSGQASEVQLRVPARSLLSVLRDENYERLDAIKLDIEGAEDLVLDAFFAEAPPALWPRLILMEYKLLRGGPMLEQRLRDLNYREVLRTNENVAYEIKEGRTG